MKSKKSEHPTNKTSRLFAKIAQRLYPKLFMFTLGMFTVIGRVWETTRGTIEEKAAEEEWQQSQTGDNSF